MKKLLAASLLSVAASGAFAEGGYVGLGYGNGSIKYDDPGIAGVTVSTDDNTDGYKVFGGYEFNDRFAVEVGYQVFHRFASTLSAPGPSFSEETIDITLLSLDVIGRYPVSNSFSVFGKLGVAQTTLDLFCGPATGIFAGNCTDSSESETNLRFGIGAEYKFTKQAGVRFDFERTQGVGNADTTGESDLDYLGLALTYRF